MNKYNKRTLTDIIYNVMNHFNETMNFDISPKNTVIEFFTRETGLVVYENFCSKYFPDWINDNYKTEGYFENFAASAFFNDNIYGILIRSDLIWSESEYFNVVLHEISHLYCCKNELVGGNFFIEYCLKEADVDIGVINAGYAVWREIVADIITQKITCYKDKFSLKQVKPIILEWYSKISHENTDSKLLMSLILVQLMLLTEILNAGSCDKAKNITENITEINYESFIQIFELVYN